MSLLPNSEILKEAQKRYKQLQLGVFSRKNSAFLAPLLCGLKVDFTDPKDMGRDYIMGVDGTTLYINPYRVTKIDYKDGLFILEHELWHVARLHNQRQGDRNPELWNHACDYVINNAMINDGTSCSIKGLVDPQYNGMSEEEVYNLLYQQFPPIPSGGGSNDEENQDSEESSSSANNQSNSDSNDRELTAQSLGLDLLEAPKDTLPLILNNVVKAKQAAQMSATGLQAGSMPADLQSIWDKFLQPKLPWEKILRNLMKDLVPKAKLSWKHRNRRYMNIHLPSLVPNSKRLGHLIYAIDTSGSVSQLQLDRINSEIKQVHDKLKPKKITVIQFDDVLQHVDVFKDSENYENITLHGGGGTSYVPVKEFVDNLAERPEGLVIFTDLFATPMQPLNDESIPVFWVAVATSIRAVPFGEYIPVEI